MPDDKYEKYIGRQRTEKLNREIIKQMTMAQNTAGESSRLKVNSGGDAHTGL
jgi:hypothetical protein